jgi:hypothetical protein
MVSARMTAGLCGLLLLAASAVPVAQSTTPTLTFSVSGLNVTLTWTAVPGAAGYQVIFVGTPGPTTPTPVNVGNVTSVSTPVPPGTYQVQVRGVVGALSGPPSNQVTISVGITPPAAPPAPTNLTAFVNGSTALLSWTLPASPISGLVLEVVGGPFAGQRLPLPTTSTSQLLPGVPAGSHALQIRAVGAGGASPASNVVTLNTPGVPCGSGATVPVVGSVAYGYASIRWPQLPGALGYQLDLFREGVPLASLPFGPAQTSVTGSLGAGNYTANVRALFSCGSLAGSSSFVSSTAPPPGPRAANPPAGQCQANGVGCLPKPSAAAIEAVLNQVHAQYPGTLQASCGNHTWLFLAVRALRQQLDTRFGLNWRRRFVGSLSDDVIVYNFSDEPDIGLDGTGTTKVYAWDVIGGHCGPSPVPAASDITDLSPGAAGAKWTLIPYLQAGYVP